MADEQKLAAVRAALPSLAAGIQLNSGSAGPMSAEVAALMAELAEYERTIGRSEFHYYLELLDRMNEARAGVAAVLGATLGSVALTHSTTDGMNLATWSLDWRPGDVAVTTGQEHAGAVGPLYALRDRFDVDVRFADIADGSDDEPTLAAQDRAIVPGTRLVSVSHVLSGVSDVLDRLIQRIQTRGDGLDAGAWCACGKAREARDMEKKWPFGACTDPCDHDHWRSGCGNDSLAPGSRTPVEPRGV